jgi:hypothetical protein
MKLYITNTAAYEDLRHIPTSRLAIDHHRQRDTGVVRIVLEITQQVRTANEAARMALDESLVMQCLLIDLHRVTVLVQHTLPQILQHALAKLVQFSDHRLAIDDSSPRAGIVVEDREHRAADFVLELLQIRARLWSAVDKVLDQLGRQARDERWVTDVEAGTTRAFEPCTHVLQCAVVHFQVCDRSTVVPCQSLVD